MNWFLEKHEAKIIQVSESGCMIWTAASTQNGYGIAYSGRKTLAGNNLPEGAHRLVFEAENGHIPEGHHVLHRCDTPSCVNPSHLFLGSQAVNMADMANKGRSCIGSRHGRSTMSEETALKIRSEYVPRRTTYCILAERYGLTRSAVAAVVRRASFKYLDQVSEMNTEGKS